MPNTREFLTEQRRYFAGSYDQFTRFGGPCVYFHRECLKAGQEAFLSDRHIEMLYATLTAWGMHRMGDTETAKTKLTDWETFRDSIVSQKTALKKFLHGRMIGIPEDEYSRMVLDLRPCYRALKLSVSGATIVVNSKALHHLFLNLIPPVDRQHTIRFFRDPPERWRYANGRFRQIQLPREFDEQFRLFHKTCVAIKCLADRVDYALLEREARDHGVSAPKAMDNAIVNYVRLVAGSEPPAD